MEKLKGQLQELDVTMTQQTSAQHSELACRDEIMSKCTSDVTILEDKLMHSQQQATEIALFCWTLVVHFHSLTSGHNSSVTVSDVPYGQCPYGWESLMNFRFLVTLPSTK